MRKIHLLLLLTTIATGLHAENQNKNINIYGFVRNDFYFNSRQCEEGIDGVFHFFPKPVRYDLSGKDANAVAQANMLSISSRVGIDINGQPILGAQSSGKIEADFAGYGVSNYVLRIRQAYMQLKWEKSTLKVGQTWHPMWGSVTPVTVSLNAGMPFQPFNRSPQLQFSHYLGKNLTFTGAAVYQMQYSSPGPKGFSPNYHRNALIPELFGGIECKTKQWTTGAGIATKTIKPDEKSLTSVSAIAYSQFTDNKFIAKAKVTIGQNLSDQLLANGYGKTLNGSTGEFEYTNLNIISSWVNLVYGKKCQFSIFGGYAQNLGSTMPLYNDNGQITIYSRGYYADTQEMISHMFRVAPTLLFNLPNLSFGVEYNLTGVTYGIVQTDGKTTQNYLVNNHRIIGSVSYFF
jgi:hypothetical protein